MITIRTAFSLLAIWATSAVAQTPRPAPDPMPSVAPTPPTPPVLASEFRVERLTSAETRFEFRSPTISCRLDESLPRLCPDQQEPADSLWRQAREQLNRGDCRRAAALFKDLDQKFPNAAYAAEAPYWQAFALCIGETTEPQEALTVLDGQKAKFVSG